MGKIQSLITKYKDFLWYSFFGILTSVVDWLVYYPLLKLDLFPASVSNFIAWVVAVLFAFITNKLYVFKSKNWGFGNLLMEFLKFSACRTATFLIEDIFILITVDIYNLNGVIMKLSISLCVAVINYIGSKFFAFKK